MKQLNDIVGALRGQQESTTALGMLLTGVLFDTGLVNQHVRNRALAYVCTGALYEAAVVLLPPNHGHLAGVHTDPPHTGVEGPPGTLYGDAGAWVNGSKTKRFRARHVNSQGDGPRALLAVVGMLYQEQVAARTAQSEAASKPNESVAAAPKPDGFFMVTKGADDPEPPALNASAQEQIAANLLQVVSAQEQIEANLFRVVKARLEGATPEQLARLEKAVAAFTEEEPGPSRVNALTAARETALEAAKDLYCKTSFTRQEAFDKAMRELLAAERAVGF